MAHKLGLVVMYMNPCEINAAITAITNSLYSKLSKEEFLFWSVVLSELSKSMFSLAALEGICKWERHHEHHERRRETDGVSDEEDLIEAETELELG